MSAGNPDAPERKAALDCLCRTYWPPVFAFIRREALSHGRVMSIDDASDLTQAFFQDFLEHNKFQHADRSRGRFRTFLIKALKNFTTGEWRRQTAKKRGGDQTHVPLLPPLDAEACVTFEPVDPGMTPDRAYERAFALTLVEKSFDGLRSEMSEGRNGRHFDAIKEILWSGRTDISQNELADRCGMKPATFNTVVHRTKLRFREILREEIANVVEDRASMDDELQYLMSVLGS